MTEAELWKLLEPLVQAAITDRLHLFHDALVSRGQITAPKTDCEVLPAAPVLTAHPEDAGCSGLDDTNESSPALPPAERLH